jgi:hypothetical protein
MPVEIRIDLHPLEQLVRESNLAGGLHPLAMDLPRAERGTDEDADAAPHQKPDDEVAAAGPTRRDDGGEIHTVSVP